MNRKPDIRFLERSTLRSVLRAKARSERKQLSREEILRLRVQTVSPWKRILGALIGILCCGGSALIYQRAGSIYAVVIVAALGVCFIGIGLLGRKKTVDTLLGVAGDRFASGVIDSIFN